MKNSFKILLHAGFWLGYCLLVVVIMFAATRGETMEPEDVHYYVCFVLGVGIIPPVLSFYSHYYYLFPRYLPRRKFLLSVLFSFLLSAAAMMVGFLFIMLTNKVAYNCIYTGFPYAVAFTFGLSTIIGIVALVLKGFLTWFEELKIKEELMEKNFRMELALVKSQLDPHFLFNTINNIDVLISKDPEEASQYLNKLSDIMRFMLYETKEEEVPLSRELEYIEKFIELQKIRTANDSYINYKINGSPQNKKVVPMVFIPFIENAFKHSTNKKIDKAIAIDIDIDEHAIVFNCRNKFEPFKNASNGYNGLGNELIKKRLNLLYPEQHTLEIDQDDKQYQVKLIIFNGQL